MLLVCPRAFSVALIIRLKVEMTSDGEWQETVLDDGDPPEECLRSRVHWLHCVRSYHPIGATAKTNPNNNKITNNQKNDRPLSDHLIKRALKVCATTRCPHRCRFTYLHCTSANSPPFAPSSWPPPLILILPPSCARPSRSVFDRSKGDGLIDTCVPPFPVPTHSGSPVTLQSYQIQTILYTATNKSQRTNKSITYTAHPLINQWPTQQVVPVRSASQAPAWQWPHGSFPPYRSSHARNTNVHTVHISTPQPRRPLVVAEALMLFDLLHCGLGPGHRLLATGFDFLPQAKLPLLAVGALVSPKFVRVDVTNAPLRRSPHSFVRPVFLRETSLPASTWASRLDGGVQPAAGDGRYSDVPHDVLRLNSHRFFSCPVDRSVAESETPTGNHADRLDGTRAAEPPMYS